MKNIYIGNISTSVTEDTLRSLFEEKGQVSRVKIIQDKFTGQSRGFGFAEMHNDEEAMNAINSLNGYMLEGRALRVNEAQDRREGGYSGNSRPPQGNGGGYNRGGGSSDRGPRSGGGSGGYGYGNSNGGGSSYGSSRSSQKKY